MKTSKEVTLLETILHRVDVALQSRKCPLGDITEDFIGRLDSGIAVVGQGATYPYHYIGLSTFT